MSLELVWKSDRDMSNNLCNQLEGALINQIQNNLSIKISNKIDKL